jgi:putative transposase
MYKAFKYKLLPDEKQTQTLIQWMGVCRYIWNWCLDTNQKQYNSNKKFIFRYDLKKQLPELKKQFPWIADVPSQALQNRVMDFDTAMKRVWKSKFGFPKFKSRHVEHHNTLRIDQTNGHINPTRDKIKIPKMGYIKWIRHRPLVGKLKSITIKKENNQWWCICLCDIGEVKQVSQINENVIVGIDLGLKDLAITSDGEIIDTPKFYRKSLKKLKRLQRKLSRKQKGSRNREKAKSKLNRLHYKIKCQRSDYLHKASYAITKQYKVICVEDLNIRGMIANRKLSRAISDQGWAMFVNMLQYKSLSNGGITVRINRFLPSSKTCSCCGHKQDMPLNIRIYTCPNCGNVLDRDINAAINIRNWGIEEISRMGTIRVISNDDYACGGNVILDQVMNWSNELPVKQESF